MLIKSQGVYILVDMPCTIFSQYLVTSTYRRKVVSLLEEVVYNHWTGMSGLERWTGTVE